ncbi:MAG: S8/S53 family peptidase [Thermoleophilia bacterium]|nr:S8/S53 family peptidase [Thermoleophilia bacterium]
MDLHGTSRGRRLLVAVASGVLAAATAGAGQAVAAESPPAQQELGSIALPLRFAADATYSTWPGGQRTAYTVAGSNGHVGYTIELHDAVDGGRFELASLGGLTGLEDFDIAFYASFSPVVSTATIMTRAIGGESGTIPEGSRYAVITLFDGAAAKFEFRAWEPVETKERQGGLAPAPLPAEPGIYPDFGHAGDRVSAWTARLKKRSHVVIALVDTGINPYHVAYRRPEYAIHPSKYVEGFPTAAPALGLSLGEGDYVKARGTDDGPVWSQVGEGKLYWIPGTNVIGAYSVRDYAGTPPGGLPSRPIVDDHGHGTGVTSVSAGSGVSSLGAPYGSNPNALIVIVEGLGDEGVKWASEQPWIDFISGSYGDPLAVPCNDQVEDGGLWCGREYRYTAPFVLRDSRTACFSAGNGLSRTGVAYDRYSSLRPTSGPSWVVTVGAVSPRNEQDYGWHSVPVDVSSYGNHWPAAAPFSTTGEQVFSGTSNATPVTCGVFSRALLAARDRLGDAQEGIHHTVDGETAAAVGPPNRAGGALADGVVTRKELEEAVFKTAEPGEFELREWPYDPIVVPNTPLYYTQQGYGVANVASALRAIDVLLGRAPMPDRTDADAWFAAVDAVRDTVYPPPAYP